MLLDLEPMTLDISTINIVKTIKDHTSCLPLRPAWRACECGVVGRRARAPPPRPPQDLICAGIVLTKVAACQGDRKTGKARARAEFTINGDFWAPNVHKILKLPIHPGAGPDRGGQPDRAVGLLFQSGFLEEHDLHKTCGKILKGKTYKHAPVDAYCRCNVSSSLANAANAAGSSKAHHDADGGRRRIIDKARKARAGSLFD